MKKKYGHEFYLKRFQEAVCFLTALDVKNRFGTVAEYEKASPAKKAYCLGFRADLAKKLSMIGPDKRAFNEFLLESSRVFKYHRRVQINHWTGGKYVRNQWFELSPETLAKWFSDETNFKVDTCALIGEKTKAWLKKHVFRDRPLDEWTVYNFK